MCVCVCIYFYFQEMYNEPSDFADFNISARTHKYDFSCDSLREELGNSNK